MKQISIKASPKQMSKLRNGHKVRCCPAIEGEGVNLLIDPSKYNQILKTFSKGKGTMVQLSPEELMANKMTAIQGEGSNIFSGVGKTLGSFAKQTGKDLRSVATAVAPAAIDVGKEVGKAYLMDKIKGSGTKKGQVRKTARRAYEDTMEGGAGWGDIAKALAPVAIDVGSSLLKSKLGGGIYAGAPSMRGQGVMGKGAILNVANSKMPPALQSQNASANFHFSTQFPPSLQRLAMGGRGLY